MKLLRSVSNSCAQVILTSQLSEEPRWRACATTPGHHCYFLFRQGSFLLPQPLQQLGLQVYAKALGICECTVCVRTCMCCLCMWSGGKNPPFSLHPLHPPPPALVGRVLLVRELQGSPVPISLTARLQVCTALSLTFPEVLRTELRSSCLYSATFSQRPSLHLPCPTKKLKHIPWGVANWMRTLLQPRVMMKDCLPTRLHSVSRDTEHLNTHTSSSARERVDCVSDGVLGTALLRLSLPPPFWHLLDSSEMPQNHSDVLWVREH